MQKLNLYQGEERHIRFLIHAKNDEPFIIRAARWELLLRNVVEASGDCLIEEHCIDCFIAPKQKSQSYELRVTYEVADEILIEAVSISVR